MVGVDEVGRGCWAGPLLVVAARAKAELPPGLKDSKLLSKKQREKLAAQLKNLCAFGEGWVTATEIDDHGLAGAMKLGVERALTDIKASLAEEVILDGSVNYIGPKFTAGRCLVDADATIPLVSAASIYAKVRRDEYMSKLQELHPAYSFEKHVGYGTAAHKLAIETNGIIEGIHRLSFKPLQQIVEAQT